MLWHKIGRVLLGKPPDTRMIGVKRKTNKLVQNLVETTKIWGNSQKYQKSAINTKIKSTKVGAMA